MTAGALLPWATITRPARALQAQTHVPTITPAINDLTARFMVSSLILVKNRPVISPRSQYGTSARAGRLTNQSLLHLLITFGRRVRVDGTSCLCQPAGSVDAIDAIKPAPFTAGRGRTVHVS